MSRITDAGIDKMTFSIFWVSGFSIPVERKLAERGGFEPQQHLTPIKEILAEPPE